MTGKRKKDFPKMKLKVGRKVPKNTSGTTPKFDSAKINMPGKKEKVGEPTLKDLLSFMNSSNVKNKFEALRKLNKFIKDNADNLPMFTVDILKEVGKVLGETDSPTRSEAISVLGQCAQILTDTQFESFVEQFIAHLECMMTNCFFQINQDSLEFLDVILKSHLSVMCHSVDFLYSLLNLISSKKKNEDVRKLIEILNSRLTSDEWRMKVLKRVLTVLSGIVSKKCSSQMISEDQKDVHWDAKEALYLPLYLNGGIEPAKFDSSLYSSVNVGDTNSSKFKTFINDLLFVISAILKGFLPADKSPYKDFVVNVDYFSIITRILCLIGEWAIWNSDLEEQLSSNLIDTCCHLLNSFPYDEQSNPRYASNKKIKCVEMNMEICYLYCMCSRLSDSPEETYLESWEDIKLFLAKMFSVSGAKLNEKSIAIALKITRVMIQCKNIDDSAKEGMLIALLGTLHTNKFSSSVNDLYAFFMELSLNYDYKDLVGSSAMREWFQRLIENLIFMMESKVFIPNYINYIKQVCARRNPHFMLTLNSLNSEKFIEFLKFDDEEFQFAIIHFIVSLDKISADFLQDLAENIRNASFSLKTVSRLIRMLHSRFSRPDVPPIDQMNFVKFLLNLGCDTFLLFEPSLDADPLPLTEVLIDFQDSFHCRCEIYPTSDYERQKEIFEICFDCLTPYLRNEVHGKCIIFFIRIIFAKCTRYPVHSMVAIFELFRRFRVLCNDVHSFDFLHNFIYSCLLYNSMITNDVPEERWIEYCVPAVQDCLNHIDSSEIISFMSSQVKNFQENHLYHALRILIFLMHRRFLDLVNENVLFGFLDELRKLDAFSKTQVFKAMLNAIYE